MGLNFDNYLGLQPKITPVQRYATQHILSTPTSPRTTQCYLRYYHSPGPLMKILPNAIFRNQNVRKLRKGVLGPTPLLSSFKND